MLTSKNAQKQNWANRRHDIFDTERCSGIDVKVPSTENPEILFWVNACANEVQICRQIVATNTVILSGNLRRKVSHWKLRETLSKAICQLKKKRGVGRQGGSVALTLWASSKTRKGPLLGPFEWALWEVWGPNSKNGPSEMGPFSWVGLPFWSQKTKFEKTKNFQNTP